MNYYEQAEQAAELGRSLVEDDAPHTHGSHCSAAPTSHQDRTPLPHSPMWDAMRRGHLIRTGHELRAHLGPIVDGIGTGIVRECCQDTPHPGADWARNTMRPECPACGGYLLPCTATATGIHPGLPH